MIDPKIWKTVIFVLQQHEYMILVMGFTWILELESPSNLLPEKVLKLP